MAAAPSRGEQGGKAVTGHWLEPIQVFLYIPTGHVLSWSGCPSVRHSHPTRTYLSKADPWLWLLVRREKTLRSLRGRVGGDEGGVKPMSAGLSQKDQRDTLGTAHLAPDWHARAQTESFHAALGHSASPAHVPICPKLTWQAAHGHRISSLSGGRCLSPGTAWD